MEKEDPTPEHIQQWAERLFEDRPVAVRIYPDAVSCRTTFKILQEKARLQKSIGAPSNKTEKLYALEAKVTKAVNTAAKELGCVLEIDDEDKYWPEVVPEALAAILASYERPAAIAAAVGFLRREGFEVTIPIPPRVSTP